MPLGIQYPPGFSILPVMIGRSLVHRSLYDPYTGFACQITFAMARATMPSVPGNKGNHSCDLPAVLESLTSKVTSFASLSTSPSATLCEYGFMKYAASRMLLPKLRMYFVLEKSGVSMSGPHVGSIPIFFEDSQVEVWLTPGFVPNVFMNLPVAS